MHNLTIEKQILSDKKAFEAEESLQRLVQLTPQSLIVIPIAAGHQQGFFILSGCVQAVVQLHPYYRKPAVVIGQALLR